MANQERAIPSWVNKWLMINSAILIVDGSFCVLRPHSLPSGCLGPTIYYGYKWYIQADKHYADPADSFIFTQGLGNLIEACICLLVLFNVFQSVVQKKMVIMFVSVMTTYKTVLFCIYSVDPGLGGRAFAGLVAEFLVFGLGSIWLFVPAYVTWVLLQDFIEIKPKKSVLSNRNHKLNKSGSADDTVDGNSSVSDSSSRKSPYNLRRRDLHT